MPRRVAVALLAPPVWAPPGVDLATWRLALAEDVLDVFATMIEVEAAVAVQEADADLLGRIGWPGLRGYVVPALDVATVFAAVAAEGYDQAVLLAGDAPDLPGMLIAKLLRPLTTRPVAAAPAIGAGPPTREEADHHDAVIREEALASGQPVDERATGTAGTGTEAARGLLGLAATIPAAGWLPRAGLDDLTPQSLRRLAPAVTDVAPAPGWHRLRSPADLARLDPRLEGWDATRALLSPRPNRAS
jgi:hypothetical protein